MRQLYAQLLRAENPDVIEEVAAQLHTVVAEYVAMSKRRCPLDIDFTTPVAES